MLEMSTRGVLTLLVVVARFGAEGEKCGCAQIGRFGDSWCGLHWTPEGEEEAPWCYVNGDEGCEYNNTGLRAEYPPIPFTPKEDWVYCDDPSEPEFPSNYTVAAVLNITDKAAFVLYGGGSPADTYGVLAVGSSNTLTIIKYSYYITRNVVTKSVQWSRQDILTEHNPLSAQFTSGSLLAVGTEDGYIVMYHAPSRGPAFELRAVNVIQPHHVQLEWGWYQEEVFPTGQMSSISISDRFVVAGFDWYAVAYQYEYEEASETASFTLGNQVFNEKMVDRRGMGVTCVTGTVVTRDLIIVTTLDGSVRTYSYVAERGIFMWDDIARSELQPQTVLPPPLTPFYPKNALRYQELLVEKGVSRVIVSISPPDAGYPARGIRRYTVGPRLRDDAWWRSGEAVGGLATAWSVAAYGITWLEGNEVGFEVFHSMFGNGRVTRNYYAEYNATTHGGYAPPDAPTRNATNETLPLGTTCWTATNPRGNQPWEGNCDPPYACLPSTPDYSIYSCQDQELFDTADAVKVGFSSLVYSMGVAVDDTVEMHVMTSELRCVSQWSCTQQNEKRVDCMWYDSTGVKGVVNCLDGVDCEGDYCTCKGHGGVARCPPERPLMCASTECLGGESVCCASDCDELGGERVCGGPLKGYRVMSTPICIPGTQNIPTQAECHSLALTLNAMPSYHFSSTFFVITPSSPADPSCYISADNTKVVWNPASTLPAAQLPSNVTALFTMIPNTSLASSVPFTRQVLLWKDLEACLAECYLDEGCSGVAFSDYQENCTFYSQSFLSNTTYYEEDEESDLYILSSNDSMAPTNNALIDPDSTDSNNGGSAVCAEDRWVVGGLRSVSCSTLALWTVITHYECVKAVQELTLRGDITLNSTFVIPIPTSYINSGCVIMPSATSNTSYVTFNSYIPTGSSFEPLTEGATPICALAEDPNRPTPVPDHYVTPTPAPPIYDKKLFYLPLWVYIVLMHIVGLSLLAIAVFFNRAGRRGPLRWARPEPELAEELIHSYKKRFDQLLESYAVEKTADATMTTCTVCLEDLIDDVIRLPCGHELHLKCMRDYVTHQVTKRRKKAAACPNCRHKLEVPEIDPSSGEGEPNVYETQENGEGAREEVAAPTPRSEMLVGGDEVEMQEVPPVSMSEDLDTHDASPDEHEEVQYVVLS